MGKKLIFLWLALALSLIVVTESWVWRQTTDPITADSRRELILVTLPGFALLLIIFGFLIRENKARAKGAASLQRTDRALQESEAQYHLLVNNLNHGLVMLNQERCFTFVNPRFCDLLGYAREDLLGHQVFEFFDRDNQETIRSQLERRERGEKTPYEIAWTRKDGTQIIALITPIPPYEPGNPLNSPPRFVAVVTDITDRKRAEAQAQQHLQSLRLLISGVEKLAQIRDPEALVPEICRLVLEAFDTGLVCFQEVESSGLIRPLYWTGKPVPCLDNKEIYLNDPATNQSPIGQALASGKPVVINDVARQQEDAPWAAAVLSRGCQAVAVFPLSNEHRIFACLSIYADQPGFFTSERLDLLQAFAGIASAAMEHARLSHKAETQLQQLQSLRQIALAISSSLDLRTILDVLLDQIVARLQVDAATVLLLDPGTPILELAAARGFKTDPIDQIRVPLDRSCAGSVALQQKPLHIPDLTTARDQCTRSDLFISEGFISYYGVPLVHQGRMKGVIEILHRSRFDVDAGLQEFVTALTGPAAVALDNASLFAEMQRSHQELSQAYEATLEGWAMALELRDIETKGHSQRVTGLTLKLAQALGVAEADLAHIYRGALLHDIGKIAVPDSILLKKGPLTSEEWLLMRQHPIFAYELLGPVAYLRPALDIPFCHHEKWNGSGYPRGLKGEEIPLAARIFSVVDVWDALGNDRSYRPAWPPEKIKAYLRQQAGEQFDPRIVKVFLEKFLPTSDAPT